MNKKVFVSGCYDMLHSGHIAFFMEAASHGDLYVGLGSDNTISRLKGRKTINTDHERLYMVQALRMVKEAWINSGSGLMDFEEEVVALHPDIFFVNEDGFTPDKQEFCSRLGIELIVSQRLPHIGLPPRSTTALRKECLIPFRLDLAGGWLDQPFVSKFHAGAVITISLEPEVEFNDRSGMASSTRKKAIDLWQTDIPEGDSEKLAKTLFCIENPPGTTYISGSQDAIGIVFPGVNHMLYLAGNYWPEKITSLVDEDTLAWLEKHLYLINLSPRNNDYDVLADTAIDISGAQRLAEAAEAVWESIVSKDLKALGASMRKSFEAQVAMFPHMINPYIQNQMNQYKSKALGWKISGAGGGGYLVLVADHPIKNGIGLKIRR
jgi:cytidyltransferase-like protein